METINSPQFVNDMAPLPEKPQFLRILCILSFIGCGLMILFSTIGVLSMALDENAQNEMWNMVLQTQPQLESIDPQVFFHEFGMTCLYGLLFNIASLVGVIFMWRLNRIGFFIYAAAELLTHFFSMKVSAGEESGRSYGGLIFSVLLDLVFITLYAVNLKHMRAKQTA